MDGLYVGAPVVFVDAVGKPHPALITAIHGIATWEPGQVDGKGFPTSPPCINVVRTADDPAQLDQYGRQITRDTSVVYRTSQPAHGYYYTFPGEPLNPVAPRQA